MWVSTQRLGSSLAHLVERAGSGDADPDLLALLRERVKELTAMHAAARIVLDATRPIGTRLALIAALLPPALRYPEAATACIRHRDASWATTGHAPTPWMARVAFVTAQGEPGHIEVAYHRQHSAAGDDPFLAEERELLVSIAELVRTALTHAEVEQTLRDSNARLNLALASAGMAVWDWDVLHDNVHWSEQLSQMTGYVGPASMPLSARADYVHADDRDHLFGQLLDVRQRHVDLDQIEFRLRRPDGGWRPIMATTRLVRDADGRVIRVLAALIDVTARHALEQGLRQAQKLEALGQIAGGVAHDFNNLLAVTLSGADLLRSELAPDHPWREIADSIHQASETGASLTRQLLAFSRKADFHPAPVDVGQLVRRLEPLLARLVHGRATLRLVIDPSPLLVWADPSQVDQVVMNLVVNARDAVSVGGVVTITTAVADEALLQRAGGRSGASFVAITVSDTGPGVPSELRARIFEPFFTTKELGTGTGLGLALVMNVARQWQGLVDLDSPAGGGAAFTLLLPRYVS